jgi:hypothetical protein
MLRRNKGDAPPRAGIQFPLATRAIASGFAWMLGGARLPAPRVFDLVLAGAKRLRA